MAWKENIINEYYKKKDELFLAGGQKYIDRQHDRGKLTARERLEVFFDNGEYNEIEMYAQTQIELENLGKRHYLGDGVICAYGNVNGNTVYVISQDSTISGGAGGVKQLEKTTRTLELAIKAKAPFIMLCESGGARIEEGILSLSAYSRLFMLNTRASGYIPQIAAIMGNCAGGSSYSPAMCDFIFMVDRTGQFFITGPKVIKAMVGQDVTMDELGGSEVHSKHSGQAHFVCKDDIECLEQIRQLLSYITVHKIMYQDNKSFDYQLLGKEIQDIVPEEKRFPYDVKEVIGKLVDKQKFFEILPEFAKNLVTGFGRFDGRSVGIIANQAKEGGGALDCDAADKCARFVRFCDCFDIPLLTLVDVPGYLPGVEQEKKGILRHGAKILYAYAEATVPQISIILRKAYGGAYCAMDSKALGCDVAFAWPICEFAVMGADGAVDILFRKQIEVADDPKAYREELIKKYEDKYLSPYFAASCGMIDEVILPEETREKIISAFAGLENKECTIVPKKHGNISL